MKTPLPLRFVWVFLMYLAGLAITASAQTPVVSVTNFVTTVSEPNATAEFLIIKDSGPDVTVNFEMVGSAVLGTDYIVIGGATSVLVPGSANIATVRIQVVDNLLIDADRTIILHLLPAFGYTIGTASATMTLHSDDPTAFRQPYFYLQPTVSQGLNPPVVAPNSPLTLDIYDSGLYGYGTSAFIFLDSLLIGNPQFSSSEVYGNFRLSRINPLLPGLHLLTAVITKTNVNSQIAEQQLRVADALLGPSSRGYISNGTLVSLAVNADRVFTRSDNDPVSSGGFMEFPVPLGATNWKAVLFMTTKSGGGAHQLFTYKGDGTVSTNDLAVAADLVAAFTLFIPAPGAYTVDPQLQFDVTHWTQTNAGGYIGFKLQIDPTKQPAVGASFDHVYLGFFSETNDVPPRFSWLNFPTNVAAIADQPFVMNLELYDPDSHVTGLRVVDAISPSYGNESRPIVAEDVLDLQPGTNFVSIQCTNISPGRHMFEIEVVTPNGTASYFYPSITFSPGPLGSPVHRWFGTSGDSKAFYLVDAAGRAWVWGENTNGQLGLGFRSTIVARPVMLAPPMGKKWRQFTSNSYCAVGVTDDGAIYGMGQSIGGALILQSLNPNVPRLLPMGDSHFARRAALAEDSLWIIDEWSRSIQMFRSGSLAQSPVVDLAAGGRHLVSVDPWGDVTYRPVPGAFSGSPPPLATVPWKDLSTCATHSLLVDADGKLFAWGLNIAGELPFLSATNVVAPQLGGFPRGVIGWTKVAAGKLVSLAVDQDGRLFSWGKKSYTGSTEPFTASEIVPVNVPPEESGWLDIAVGSSFAMALSTRGNVYVWGDIPASPSARHVDFPERVTGLPDLLSDSAPTTQVVTFQPASIQPSSQFAVDLIAPTGSNLVIETSSDLLNWTTVTNIVSAAPKSMFTAPIPGSGNLFIRVR